MKCIALTCAVLAASLQACAAEKLIGGPFVVHDGPTSATVTWIVEGGEDKKAPAMRAARALYSGLQPGTTYYYDALGRDESRGSFKTAPLGLSDFQFVVYGDTRTRHDMHRRVIAAVIKHGIPDFVMHTISTALKTDAYSLNYDGFGVIAIKGLQELLTTYTEQNEKITLLKKKADELEKAVAKIKANKQ